MRVKDKVAVVTGAGRGLGRAYALALAKEGARVVVNDVDLQVAEEVVKEIKDAGGEAVANSGDVSKWDGGKDIIDTAVNKFGRIDVLVNNDPQWSVYAFRNFPGLNMPMYGDIPLSFSMLEIKTGGSAAGEVEGSTYYTVLGVVRDRGTPVMWVGAALLMLGMFLSFYVRPRRIWALEDNGKILVGGRVKGDPEQFSNFVKRTINQN